MGPKPVSLNQRYLDLFEKFADAWRVTDKTSLFDYAPGTSTASFTIDSWPKQNPPCTVPQSPLAQSLDLKTAQRLCRGVFGKNRKADCIFDVMVTGEPSFANLYRRSERIQAGLTTTIVSADKDPTRPGEPVTFTALVAQAVSLRRRVITGSVEFSLDGERVGHPIKLDSRGQARWRSRNLKAGRHQFSVRYIPASGTSLLASLGETLHSVNGRE